VVGIVGPQSSGKSSLFNRAFETAFQVMDMDRGYSQTTKGAMLAEKDGLLLLDMEGSDSRERDIAGQKVKLI
jgi:predicted GTPase